MRRAWEDMGKAEKTFRTLANRRNSKLLLGRQEEMGYHIMLSFVNKLCVGMGVEWIWLKILTSGSLWYDRCSVVSFHC